MYTAKVIERYTRQLAKLGITDEAEVNAVLEYIHKAVCIAVQEFKTMNKETNDENYNQNDAA